MSIVTVESYTVHSLQQNIAIALLQCEQPLGAALIYRPQRSWGKVMFLQVSVILFTRGDVCQVYAGIHPPTPRDQRQTPAPPPRADTTPSWADILPPLGPETDTLPLGRRPPEQCILGYGQETGGTHPTGMHSCLAFWFRTASCIRVDYVGDRNNLTRIHVFRGNFRRKQVFSPK